MKQKEREAGHSLLSNDEIKNGGAGSPFPITASWRDVSNGPMEKKLGE
jgi:hypothetical protein